MNNIRIFTLIALLFASILSAGIASASYDSSCYSSGCYTVKSFSSQSHSFSQPRDYSASSYGSSSHYQESPGFAQFPNFDSGKKSSLKAKDSNFDSSSSGYDYRGPLYEKKFVQLDDFRHEISSKDGFFSSKNKDSLKHTVSTTITEKYIGASESAYSNSQNRRSSSLDANQDESLKYQGGFSFGKQRLFDQSEYGSSRNSYASPYYYSPYYDSSSGYYSWRY